jgi:hypothetical protein
MGVKKQAPARDPKAERFSNRIAKCEHKTGADQRSCVGIKSPAKTPAPTPTKAEKVSHCLAVSHSLDALQACVKK